MNISTNQSPCPLCGNCAELFFLTTSKKKPIRWCPVVVLPVCLWGSVFFGGGCFSRWWWWWWLHLFFIFSPNLGGFHDPIWLYLVTAYFSDAPRILTPQNWRHFEDQNTPTMQVKQPFHWRVEWSLGWVETSRKFCIALSNRQVAFKTRNLAMWIQMKSDQLGLGPLWMLHGTGWYTARFFFNRDLINIGYIIISSSSN